MGQWKKKCQFGFRVKDRSWFVLFQKILTFVVPKSTAYPGDRFEDADSNWLQQGTSQAFNSIKKWTVKLRRVFKIVRNGRTGDFTNIVYLSTSHSLMFKCSGGTWVRNLEIPVRQLSRGFVDTKSKWMNNPDLSLSRISRLTGSLSEFEVIELISFLWFLY
jgi:hypothetical protein